MVQISAPHIALSSEELRERKEIDQNALLHNYSLCQNDAVVRVVTDTHRERHVLTSCVTLAPKR